MAFSIKQVKAKLQEYGVQAENLDAAAEYFCAAHKTDLDAIKEQRDTYKTDAETLTTVKKELDELKAAGDGGLSVLQEKYNTLEREHKKLGKEYEQYKTNQTAKETRAAKEKAYRSLVKAELDPESMGKIADSLLDRIIKVSHADGVIDGLELDESGAIKDADKLKESIKADWADFIVTVETRGADIAHPPAIPGGSEENKANSRAAQIAAAYHNSLYGELKKE